MDRQITILGATGFTGKELVKQANERGYNVKVLVRSKPKLVPLSEKVEIVEGEYFNHDKISEAIEGSFVILSTIGPALKAKSKDVDVVAYHAALKHIVKSVNWKGLKKFINISGAGIAYPNERLPFARKLMRFMLKLTAAPVAKVKDGELEILFNSDIPFINVRPPLIKEAEGIISADESELQGMTVGVKQLAGFMLDNIENPKWNRRAPVVGSK